MKKDLAIRSFHYVALTALVLGLFVYHSGAVVSGVQASDADAKTLFEKNCATCHGKDGRAKTFKAKFNHARDLTGAAWQNEASDERIFNSIANGRGRMPAWAKKLTEGEMNSLVMYVRQLKR